jgi:hypothetical protein
MGISTVLDSTSSTLGRLEVIELGPEINVMETPPDSFDERRNSAQDLTRRRAA